MCEVEIGNFGSLNDQQIQSFTLKSSDVEVVILNYGGIIQALRTKDRNGDFDDITTGFTTISEYPEKSQFFGSLVGRYANRIGGAKFDLNGKTYNLFKNNGGDPFQNSLHGGKEGFDKKIWASKTIKNGVELSYTSADGEEGYPGTLQTTVVYKLEGNTFSINYIASSDSDTVINLTNHAYFNLDGHKAWSTLDSHTATIFADSYVPVNEVAIPTGSIAPVEGTTFDCRKGVQLTQENLAKCEGGMGYDHNFCIKNSNSADMVKVASVSSAKSGRQMDLSATQPGVQFYTGNFLRAQKGKGGVAYAKQTAFCLETQHFPDSPNQSAFPSAVLKAGQIYDQTAKFSFSAK